MTVCAPPGQPGSLATYRSRYEHSIGGEWVAPSAAGTSRTSPRSTASRSVRSAAATPTSILFLMDLIGDLLPAGVLNIVNGFGVEAGKPLELGGKSPNIFFEDVASADDVFYDKALEGFTMFALNQGEVCTCPSRALIQDSIYDWFLSDATERTKKVIQGNPLDDETMIGAQASNDQLEKILSYFEIGQAEGARIVTGGERVDLGGDLSEGY